MSDDRVDGGSSAPLAPSGAFPRGVDDYEQWWRGDAGNDQNSGNESSATGGQVEYQLTNGGTGTLEVGRGQSASKDPGSKIKAFRACTNYYIDGYPIKGCSSWAYFS